MIDKTRELTRDVLVNSILSLSRPIFGFFFLGFLAGMQTGRDLSRLDQGRRGFGGRAQRTERQNSAAAQYRSRQPAERAAGRGRGDLDSPKKREK